MWCAGVKAIQSLVFLRLIHLELRVSPILKGVGEHELNLAPRKP